MSGPSESTLSGPEKVAVLLMALGSEKSTQLVSTLTSQEIEQLASHLARTQQVDEKTKAQVLEEFQQASQSDASEGGGLDYARELLINALGAERAESVISRLEFASEVADISVESEKEADRLGRVLRSQHPQLAAAVLSRLQPAMAARVLGSLSSETRLEVALRLVDMETPDLEAFRRLGQALRSSLVSSHTAPSGPAQGKRRLAEILNSADKEIEQGVLSDLQRHNPTLAKQVRDRMFTFEDLSQLEPRELQLVLRTVSQDDLRMALQTTGDKLKQYIFSNMSERAAAALKEDMETAGPVKPDQSHAAQRRIAAAARQLAKEGTLSLKSESEPAEEGEEEEENEAGAEETAAEEPAEQNADAEPAAEDEAAEAAQEAGDAQ